MITFENVSKRYKQQPIIDDVSFTVEKGDVVVLIGPSGCGKTTTLKMINRLVSPTSGRILVNGEDIQGRSMVKLRRNMGYVIQQVGLFPHMTVRENIELVPRLEKYERKKVLDRSAELMDMVGLDPGDYLDRYPTQLSGGQQQRVGVARAFACDPDVILMDEPFSAIDPITRAQLQDELAGIQEKMRKTIVFVTHDIDEAVKVGDKICLMNEGRIVQYDTCEEILKNPATEFVTEFVGHHRIWTAPEFIRAKDIMIDDPVTCPADTTVRRCLERMKKADVNSIMLVAKGKFVGIVGSSSARRVEDKSIPALDIANTDSISIRPDDTIVSLLEMVNASDAKVVPVVNDSGALEGIITRGSLINTLSQRFIDSGEDKGGSQRVRLGGGNGGGASTPAARQQAAPESAAPEKENEK